MPTPIDAEYAIGLTSSPPQNPSQQSFIQKKRLGGVDFTVEFNDSVLSTKGWNNPRYSGSKLMTQNINEFTNGDIAYGKSAGVQKYTNNIYIGSTFTDLENTNNFTLTRFPSSSYIYITDAITVNTRTARNSTKFFFENNDDAKIGFYRSFLEDFPMGKNISLKLLDSRIPNFLNDTYNVYFNGGRLRQILTLSNNGDSGFITLTGNGLRYADTTTAYTASATLSSKNYTANTHFNFINSKPGDYTSGSITTIGVLDNFFDNITSGSEQNRFFATIGTDSPFTFLDTSDEQLNRRAYYTYEIQRKHPTLNRVLDFSQKFGFNSADVSGEITPNKQGYKISVLDDNKPCLLIQMQAEKDLPSGLGDAPIIIIPHNLHPFVKDNLVYFLSKAGIDVGDSTIPDQIIVENQTLT
jgi:hypothetical protein